MDERIEKYGKFVYHYTTWEAFYSIIKNKELWLSNILASNDKLEMRSFINELKNGFINTENINQAKLKDIFRLIESKIEDSRAFAFCLSQNEDDAAQWDRYANHGCGVCVVFDTKKLLNFLENNFIFNQVFYIYDVKQNDYYKTLLSYLQDKTNVPFGFSSIDSYVENLLAGCVIRKHKSFQFENEIRLAESCIKFKRLEHSFEISNGKIKEVKKLKLGSDIVNVIDKIVAGPCSTQNLCVVKNFLKEYGCEQLSSRISISNCPLR